jgi:hypothetical protein
MSELRPVGKDYNPGYPRELTAEEVERLLRPGLLSRFTRETLAAGAVLVGAGLLGGRGEAAPLPGPGELPKAGLSTRKDEQFRKKIDRLTAEILGDKVGSWNAQSMLRLQTELAANPPLKYPHIPISFGNSYVGIFDTEKAREATRKLFAQWGIELQKEVAVKGPGYQFVPDGYNKELRIGFKIVMPEGAVGLRGKKFEPEPEERKLDDKEIKALDADVQAGRLRVLVVRAAGFPNMDGDLYTPMEYYLASVIDYLNWVHGDKQLDRNSVLGKPRQPDRIRKEVQTIEKKAKPVEDPKDPKEQE